MRVVTLPKLSILFLALIAFALVPTISSRAEGPCAVTVSPGESIQGALDAAPPKSTVCVSSGTYSIPATLIPKFRQTLVGLGDPTPVILCPPPVVFCIDGSAGPEKVRLSRLIFDGARAADIRTGNGWKLSYIEARNAGVGGSSSGVGIVVNGSKVSIVRSYAHDNWQFGIRAVNATDLIIKNSEVAFNPTDPAALDGFSGGMKFNGVIGLIAKKDFVHDNGGGGGMWLDVDSQNFQLIGNRVVDDANDEIRVETSCYGSLESNTVSGGSNAGIDLFNAHDVIVRSNISLSPVGALFGIRMLNNGRTASVGTGDCRIDGSYQNLNNQAQANSITMLDPETIVGVDSNGGFAAGNVWLENEYTVPDCLGAQWRWWDGSVEQDTSFSGWQAFGQDPTGSCDSISQPAASQLFLASSVISRGMIVRREGDRA